MSVKKIYFHIFVINDELYLSSISGGINAIDTWIEGLDKNRYQVFKHSNMDFNMKEFLQSDLIIICNARAYLQEIQKLCEATKKSYATIPFFEEQELYWPIAKQFVITIENILNSNELELELQRLELQQFQTPQTPCIDNQKANIDVFTRAQFNLTNSNFEATNLRKLAPKSRIETIQLSCGIVENKSYAPNNEFLKKTGLSKGEYIVQVGRIDMRKNQLTSVISTRNSEAPLVFIFSQITEPTFSLLLLAIKKLRKKKRTILITNKRLEKHPSHIEIIHLNKPISDTFIISALQNAGLHLHPAFYELPGYTYLEAAKLGVATVAGRWGSLKDYFTNSEGKYTLDKRISYVLPYDIHTLEKRIESQFGRRYPNIEHPTFRRTKKEMSTEMQTLLDKYI